MKSKVKIPEAIKKSSRIIAHWREFYGRDEAYEIIKNIAEIDRNLEALARHIGRTLTGDEQSAVLDIVDEFMPKDESGNYYWPLVSFEKAWEVYELRNLAKKIS